MRLSKKADYALRVLLTLIDEQGHGPQSLTELARRNDVPKKFLEHIMLDLKERLGRQLAGPAWGYVLATSPELITMGRSFAASTADGPNCLRLARHARDVLAVASVPVSARALEVRNRTAQYLDSLTLADIAGWSDS